MPFNNNNNNDVGIILKNVCSRGDNIAATPRRIACSTTTTTINDVEN